MAQPLALVFQVLVWQLELVAVPLFFVHFARHFLFCMSLYNLNLNMKLFWNWREARAGFLPITSLYIVVHSVVSQYLVVYNSTYSVTNSILLLYIV